MQAGRGDSSVALQIRREPNFVPRQLHGLRKIQQGDDVAVRRHRTEENAHVYVLLCYAGSDARGRLSCSGRISAGCRRGPA
jgi:hypothetical protein